jgi:hypothetical protein
VRLAQRQESVDPLAVTVVGGESVVDGRDPLVGDLGVAIALPVDCIE